MVENTPVFSKILRSFVPSQLLEGIDVEAIDLDSGSFDEFSQKVMDESKNRLKMYGSAEELADLLNCYQDFTSSHRFFKMTKYQSYTNSFRIFKNMRNETFIYKQDMLVALESTFVCRKKDQTGFIVGIAISTFIKSYAQHHLDNCIEFVRFNEQYFIDIKRKINETMDQILRMTSFPPEFYPPFAVFTMENFEEHCRNLFSNLPDSVTADLIEFFKHYCVLVGPDFDVDSHANLMYVNVTFINMIMEIIDSNPELYKPYDYKTSETAPVTVRIFENILEKNYKKLMILMKSELFNALNIKREQNESMECTDEPGLISVMELNQVFKSYGEKVKNIEFIRIPITRIDHVAVPILTPSGDFCIPISDEIKEIVHRLIFVHHVFQKIDKTKKNVLKDYFELLEKNLNSNTLDSCFITFDVINQINEMTEEYWEKYENIHLKPIRKTPKTITIEYLKNELKYLGILDIFPNCNDFVEKSLDFVTIAGEGSHSIRLFCHAITQIVFSASLNKFPSMIRLFREQNECVDEKKIHPELEGDKLMEKDAKLKVLAKIALEYEHPCEKKETETDPDDDLFHEFNKVQELTQEDFNSKDLIEEIKRLKEVNEKQNEINSRSIDTGNRLAETNDKIINELKKLNSKLKISEQKNEKMKEQMEKMKNESEKVIRRMETEKKKQNAENRKIVKELTESEAKLSKKVTELESQLEEEKKKTQKVEQEAKQQKIESHRKFVALETENKKLSKSLEQQKIDRSMEKDYSEILNQMRNQLKERNIAIENVKKEVNNKKRELSEFREMSNVIKKSMEEEVLKKTETITELTLKNGELESLLDQERQKNNLTDRDNLILKNEELELLLEAEKEKTKKLAHGAIQQLQRISGSRMNLDFDKEMTDKNRIINELQTANHGLLERIDQQNLTINAFFTQFGTVKKEFHCAATQTEEQNGTPYDDECVICLTKMNPNEHIFECNHCQKETHLECSQKWFQQNSTCVHCRGLVRLPSEFPPLS